jgi:GNAT superfamily N-acetyltransferase
MIGAPIPVRAMQPGDVPAAAEMQLSFFPEHFLCQLGRPVVRLFFRELVLRGQVAFVATDGDRVVGFIIGILRLGSFYRELLRRRAFALTVAILPTAVRRPAGLLRVGRALLRPGRRTVGARTATFMFMAVTPGLQGQGVGRQLMDAALDRAADLGATRVYCQTAKFDNDRTIAFVQAMGFQLVGETAVAGSVRYDCELNLPRRAEAEAVSERAGRARVGVASEEGN